jgi:hypothetical protein
VGMNKEQKIGVVVNVANEQRIEKRSSLFKKKE